jgi:LPS-assembly lipoprotein
MMRALAIAACIAASLAASACGFEPLYATGSDSANIPNALRRIEVLPLQDRNGQLLQTALQRRLSVGGAPATVDYTLDIALRESVQGFGIRGDAAPTRQRVRMIADYRLVNKETDAEMFAGSALSDTTIDIVDSEYATFIAEESATERNSQVVAERILSRLALYFRALAETQNTQP